MEGSDTVMEKEPSSPQISGKVIIIHGSFGHPLENWFPWLQDKIRQLGHEAIVPKFPTPDGQSLDSWLDAFYRQAGKLEQGMILVGHSLGPAFILRLLERSEKPVMGIFLVSGFLGSLNLPKFDEINSSFLKDPFRWDKIRANAGYTKVYYGDNDPYVPLEQAEELARALGVEPTVIRNGGHLNESAGFKSFGKLFEDITDAFSWRRKSEKR